MDVWKEGKKEERNKWERQREVDEKKKQAPHTTHKRMKIFFLKSDPGGWTKTRIQATRSGRDARLSAQLWLLSAQNTRPMRYLPL